MIGFDTSGVAVGSALSRPPQTILSNVWQEPVITRRSIFGLSTICLPCEAAPCSIARYPFSIKGANIFSFTPAQQAITGFDLYTTTEFSLHNGSIISLGISLFPAPRTPVIDGAASYG